MLIPLTSDYSYSQNFERELSAYELKTVSEIDVWYEYKRLDSLNLFNSALQELLNRHDSSLRSVSRIIHNRSPLISDYDDKLQHARYSAIQSYQKFDIDIARVRGVRLSTYVIQNASFYLKHVEHHVDSFIHFPSSMLLIRNYLRGFYDNNPRKKCDIEKRLGIRDEQHRADLMLKFRALNPEYVHLSDVLSSTLVDDSNNDLDNCLFLQSRVQKLSILQQNIIECLSNNFTINEIAVQLNMNEKFIRSEIRSIRTQMNRYSNSVASQSF